MTSNEHNTQNPQEQTDMNAQLREAEERVQIMLDAMPLCANFWDKDHQNIDCNAAAVKLFELKNKQEYLDRFFELSPEFQPDGEASAIKAGRNITKAFEDGYCQFEWMHQKLNGDPVPSEITLVRVKYKDDFIVAGYTRDMRELQHKDRLLRDVNKVASILLEDDDRDFANVVGECIEIMGRSVDVDRTYIWKNHDRDGKLSCTQIYEWSEDAEPQQGNGLTVDILYEDTIPTWEHLLSKGQSINCLVKNMSPQERDQLEPQGIVSILVVPIILQNHFWGFIGFDDCKNERIFSEIEENILRSGGLLIAAAMLRNEITKNLISATRDALSSTEAKSIFLANMSHEIRTPMNAIIGMTTIAQSTNDRSKISDCLKKIEMASKHLLGVINDVLDMSKIEANKFELAYENFAFTDMVHNVLNMATTRSEDKHQQLIVDIADDVPEFVVGDELRLAQVLTNLLSNANKFTPEGGTITMTVNALSRKDNVAEIQIAVTDTGIGIPEENIETLFNAFEQVDRGNARKFGGTGLGLVISKNIIEMMGGHISVTSELGKGSTFSFNIFITVSADDGTSQKTDDFNGVYDFRGKRILLAEDIEINREIVISLLEDTGADIDCAENGEIALKKFEDQPDKYDLIFMDIHMPVMDGYTATKNIRSLPMRKAYDIPIIAMTANAFQEDIDKCKSIGMDDHISKPIDMAKLLEITHKHLQSNNWDKLY